MSLKPTLSRTAAALYTAGVCSAGLLLPAAAWAAGHAAAARAEAPKAAAVTTPAAAAATPPAAGATTAVPAGAQPGAAAAAADPLEQLRLRLAERPASGKAPATPYDVRVVARTPPAPAGGRSGAAARAGGHGAAVASAAATRGGDPHAGGAAHWGYAGVLGPGAWGGIKPEFSLCNSGQRQSPIDIRGGLAVDLDPVRFDYQASRFAVVDNGHTVQVNMASGNSIEIGGKRYDLLQFHFHRPSEERIDGRQFEMSVHLVHKDDQGRLAVVALLLDKGPAQPVVQKVWNNLPLERGEEAAAKAPLDLAELLPNDRRYYTYMGSLTTPPCSEGVQWIVMRQPVTVTPEQIEIFARMYPMNARPPQQASGRRILQSN